MSIVTDFARLMKQVRKVGHFATSGTCAMGVPSLNVVGIGPIAFPVLSAQVKALTAIAEPAPYGRGEKTLVDSRVRRTLQIDPGKIELRGRGWNATLSSIVQSVSVGLGVSGGVSAELYKMLVYDKGSFFVSHRDTEKVPGMFATLVIGLPSKYSGGELIVRHKNNECAIDLHVAEPSEIAFAAFYADCLHEIRPITSGCRITLVYNLLYKKKATLPRISNLDPKIKKLTDLLRGWASQEPVPTGHENDAPVKLVYPLEHVYTQASLSFDALKGADAARAKILTEAAANAHCDFYLALLTIYENGSAEAIVPSYWGSRRSYYDNDNDNDNDNDDDDDEEADDTFEVIEVDQHRATLSEWCRPDGSKARMPSLPYREDELAPQGALDGIPPDEQSFEEATGNAGASFERTYRRAAFVLWPKSQHLKVLNSGGLEVTLPKLAALTKRWSEASVSTRAPIAAQAHELASYMIETWSKASQNAWGEPAPSSEATQMLSSLIKLGDSVLIERFLAEVTVSRSYSRADNAAIVRSLRLLNKTNAIQFFNQIIAINAEAKLEAVTNLVLQAAKGKSGSKSGVLRSDLQAAAAILLAQLPVDPPNNPETRSRAWQRPVTVSLVVEMITALSLISIEYASGVINKMLANPKSYSIDIVLIPAALRLDNMVDAIITKRLCDACLAHLDLRIGLPLFPPSDFVRESAMLRCSCRHCHALRHFLGDPQRESWHFKASQGDRKHVESHVRAAGCDLDCSTLRLGSPHTLVCQKNDRSYRQRVQQRESDLQNRERLASIQCHE